MSGITSTTVPARTGFAFINRNSFFNCFAPSHVEYGAFLEIFRSSLRFVYKIYTILPGRVGLLHGLGLTFVYDLADSRVQSAKKSG